MAIKIPWDLFQKFASGELRESDEHELEQWRRKTDLNNLIYEEITSDQNFCESLRKGFWKDNSKEWENLLERINPQIYKTVKLSPRNYWLSAVAAGLLLLIGLSVGWLFTRSDKLIVSGEDAFTYIYSPRGQRTQVVLPDKSKVWLNSETSMRYSSSFNTVSREVEIEGEAFFEVEKNPEKPFIVNASEIKVKVYGTSFNVKAYPHDKTIETTLIEGRLSIIPNKITNEGSGEVFLNPQQKITYTKADGSIGGDSENQIAVKERKQADKVVSDEPRLELISNVDIQPESSWKVGKLYFKDETFGEMAIKLERWYDVKLHFEDEEIKEYRFTGVFDKETINQAMEALRLSSQQSYRYTMKFRDIYIRKH
jgi:ferric-dicitrate binding protein FerR (iron transport regulator)